ncbi:CidA/LrgA family protein [Virgibacillus salexigens]|uniref:Antiholin-like protein LrgA n=2 Tax=Virgibacillus TaxID=84406 RepID=A0A024QFU1_9BACI|nr:MULTISPECIES: CidA/LrgA family protein [Virgibacillus]CDQ40831.1 Antiholin-like protein LrgA [Virgibacillus massiliensis]
MIFRWFIQLGIINLFLLLGYGIAAVMHLPLPGSIIGMILLFFFLLTGVIRLEWIEKISNFQLKHLTLLFIPPLVTLFLSTGFIQILQWNILFILLASSICCLLGTGFAVELYEKRRNVE